MNEATLELDTLLRHFVDGDGTSLVAANRLELLLSDLFPDDEVVNDRVGDLAQYRPGGGEFLVDAEEMRARLARLRSYLTLKR